MEADKKVILCRTMYIVILIAASIPIFCGYVMDGGDILMWLARIEEVKEGLLQGRMVMFPSAQLVSEYGGQVSALDSNLWFLLPALFRLMGVSIAVSYCLFMLIIQAGTFITSKLMFGRFFSDRVPVMFGVLFYMTCPYRLFICYDKGNLGRSIAWMLIPLFVYGIAGLLRFGLKWQNIVIASAAFAGIGYGDSMMAIILTGLTIFSCIWYRKLSPLQPLIIGGIVYLPGGMYLLRYLFKGGMIQWDLPLQTISASGYAVGQFFTSFAYREGMPGMGLGLFMALLILLWLRFTEKDFVMHSSYKFSAVAASLLLLFSLASFPWDLVQRAGTLFLRLIPLLESPGIFFGCANIFLCIPAAYAMECAMKKEPVFFKVGLPVIVITASIAVSVYLCNTLTYMRLPMSFQEHLINF